MFSWSTNRKRPGGSTTTETTTATDPFQYPGSRSVNGHSGVMTTASTTSSSAAPATAIHGTIRPPTNGGGSSYTRQEHLDSYIQDSTLARSTRRISTDDTTFDTVFQTVSGDTLILRVHIPVTLGTLDDPPTMTLAGVSARHPWLDDRMRVIGFQPTTSSSSWRSAGMKLGVAVHQVVQHLQVNPPKVLRFTDTTLAGIQKNKDNQQRQQPSSASKSAPSKANEAPPDYDTLSNANALPIPDVNMPAIPKHFDEIAVLEREELDRLLKDNVELMAFCNTLPIAKSMQEMTLSVVDENAIIAKESVEKKEELTELRDRVVVLQKRLREHVERFREMEKRQDKLCAPPDPKPIIKRLTKATKEAFDESEKMADDWLDGDVGDKDNDVDSFLRRFLEARTLHHERAAKLELLATQPSQSDRR